MDYKANITLNEKDSLQDMLNQEKNMAKVYSTAMTEGVSEDYRNVVKNLWEKTTDDQLCVYNMMVEHGYVKNQPVQKEQLKQEREKFCKVKEQLA